MSVPVPEESPAASARVCDRGVELAFPVHVLRLEVCASNIIRVVASSAPGAAARKSFAVLPRPSGKVSYAIRDHGDRIELRTDELLVTVNRRTGAAIFADHAGRTILAERSGGRTFTSAVVQGEPVWQVRQLWERAGDEALYGLGQHAFGQLNIQGRALDLWQRNGVIAVPMLTSSRGYGVLWDQACRTRFGDPRDPALLCGEFRATFFADREFLRPVVTRVDRTIAIAAGPGVPDDNRRIHPSLPATGEVAVRWEGNIRPERSGLHMLQPFYNAGLKVWVDGVLVIDHWRQGWLYWYDQALVPLEAGREHRIRLEWIVDQGDPTLRLECRPPEEDAAMSLWSEATDAIDYYFIHGPDLDRVIAGYRLLTGAVPLPPVWAFGLWQSRERYRTAQESLDVLARYRRLEVPVDAIVQDWLYWRLPEWGSHAFDPERFPDPAGWVRAVHEQFHARLMLSLWPKFHVGTPNFEALRSRGFLYEPNLAEDIKDWLGFTFTFYDAFNPAARELYWRQVEASLGHFGIDAWWLDATEPEMRHAPAYADVRDAMHPTAAGPSARVLLAYPLVHNEGIYQHARASHPDRRVFLLTRSGFAGLQRCAAACWSGDITSTWSSLRQQIPAGLGFCLSGLPYWTTDSGGFAVPPRWCGRDQQGSTADVAIMEPAAAEEWAELNTRWLQYATFCPLMRIHGQFPFREIWEFGGEDSPAFGVMSAFIRLRYRLLPYLYSVAGSVTHSGGTLMRALVMDFPDDATAREIGHAFMFGPALLVAPVTAYRVRTLPVYLPSTPGGWYCFWHGTWAAAGQTVDVEAPYERIPVHVRAGAIVPLGPEKQFTTEKPADPLTVLIYAGADGAFTLYEDDGLSYAYERGAAARIPLRWDDDSGVLTIGAREGGFPGMLEERTFQLVLVSTPRPAGYLAVRVDREVRYAGEEVRVDLRASG